MDTDSSPAGDDSKQKSLSPEKEALLKQILALRDSIEARRGILPESWTLLEEDHQR